ncbi:hypothetical protein [Nocardia sp. NPDC005998]|uniref:hypothetical protein n=1 Tax=Nocardia sp. NPDC005998 TaxID=3156894 RepID=UPI0033A85551
MTEWIDDRARSAEMVAQLPVTPCGFVAVVGKSARSTVIAVRALEDSVISWTDVRATDLPGRRHGWGRFIRSPGHDWRSGLGRWPLGSRKTTLAAMTAMTNVANDATAKA